MKELKPDASQLPTENTESKSCPFCGGKALKSGPWSPGGDFAKCDVMKCPGARWVRLEDWNRRAPTLEGEVLRELLAYPSMVHYLSISANPLLEILSRYGIQLPAVETTDKCCSICGWVTPVGVVTCDDDLCGCHKGPAVEGDDAD